MDAGFETGFETADFGAMDAVSDIPDIPADIPVDIPEDTPIESPEMFEDNDFTPDIPEDTPIESPEMFEDNDFTPDIPEDTPIESPEMLEDNDFTPDIPEDTPIEPPEMLEDNDFTPDIPEDTPIEPPEMLEDNDFTPDIPEDTPTESPETSEDALQEAPDIPPNDPEAASAEQIDQPSDDGPAKVLKRDELELLKSGNDAINKRLEATADDYRDKGLSEDEIADKLAADKWNYQKEFLEDAFPNEDVSPNVFNGFSENGAQDRINEIENSESLRDQLQADTADEGALDTPIEDDGTDWERTSLRPEDEQLLHEMEENGELDVKPSEMSHSTVDMSVPRISEAPIEIDMPYNENTNPDEFLDQGYMQEDGLNALTIDEYLRNYENRIENGRAAEGTEAQQEYRYIATEVTADDLMTENPDMSYAEARQAAKDIYKNSAALHNPDQIAGGEPTNIHALGSRSVNSSFGSLWGHNRAEELHSQVVEMSKNMTDDEKKNTFLHVKLNMHKK